ncbi:AzlD domain-containing protein [Wenxinia saemankumensis]|uniref:Branched-chain amino acid transport protein n=1 Tax=Wenxinia saemankumensis TaxID=1447782 RepID=A0A1M6E8W1_9RHOB|nr:AzlD domain-containing protein [Wenxinia saemankumensis]SHI81885.1 Branched-chain amino acid transport protein [Wenxinia saemankumensis]
MSAPIDAATIWIVIAALGAGSWLIRFSFLGLIGDREMPPLAMRLLRYTPVAVLPGLVAPYVVWPDATGGEPDAARMLAALVTLGVGLWRRSMLPAVGAGAVTLYAVLALQAWL